MTTTYTLINKTILGSNQTGLSFTSIPSTYTDLKLVFSVRGDYADASVWDLNIGFNSTTTGYSNRFLLTNGGTGIASGTNWFGVTTGIGLGYFNVTNNTANTFCNSEIYIPNYASSNYKSVSVEAAAEQNSGSSGATGLAFFAGLWSNTAAISSLNVFSTVAPTFLTGSSFYLYGIKNS
jgi:hypothetical protein